jgi:gas vesicle protein
MFLFKGKQKILYLLSVFLLLIGTLTGCAEKIQATTPSNVINAPVKVTNKLAEVAPPKLIQQLNQSLLQYQPQVKIISPQENQVVSDSNLKVNLQVLNLPIFKDQEYEMGPHLHLILDNEPYRSVYDVSQPVTLENLAPGSHTLRVFAAKPWGESFKNDGSYDQVTFHVFTKSNDNTPDSKLPLLTYNNPKGGYGAEPIMLDYYLTNAPLHLIAQQNPDDNISDWRIKVTVNGESFFVDNWQSIYLKGFQPGNNWVQLEFIDEKGNEIANVFNDTVRVINYQPKGEDMLSKIVRGDLTLDKVKGIVDPSYKPEIKPEITPVTKEIKPEITPIKEEVKPEVTPIKEEVKPEVTPIKKEVKPEVTPIKEEIKPEITPVTEEIKPEIKPEITPVTEELKPEVTPEITPIKEEVKPEITPVKEEVKPEITPVTEEVKPEITPVTEEIKPEIITENQAKNEPTIQEKANEKIKSIGNFFNQLKTNLSQ